MTRYAWACANLSFVIAVVAGAAENKATFDGEWRTSLGVVTLKQAGKEVTGTYGNSGQFKLEGTVEGNKLTFEYDDDQAIGEAHWTLEPSGNAFRGDYKRRNGQGATWEGWRPDPEAIKGKAANLAGLWLTDFGLMELEQTGEKVKGRYARIGVSEIEGGVTGRRFEFTYKSFRPGKGWFDLAEGAPMFAGAANEGFPSWYGWRGRRAREFARSAKLIPGKIADGSTEGLLTYAVRAPERYKEGDGKKWPAIVILHGSNMNAKAYVGTIAGAWPDIARDYLLIGINGEQPSDIGNDPRFNYSYVDYVGRSTFKGYPGTDRESPALVAEAMKELRETYPVSRYFVGGHSQGGFLTYSLLMNFPELIAGALPISAGVIFQCEPSAYRDEELKAAQRAVPLTIVHSKQDPVVSFSSGEYAATIFGEAGWPAFHFFADGSAAGHQFGLLPVNQAIRWLEAQSSDDPAKLLDFAERRFKAKGYRDAVAAVNRAGALKPAPAGAAKARLDRLSREIDTLAAAGARQFLPQIQGGKPGKAWIDAFHAYREDFEFAPAAREVMQAFATLRAEHEAPAGKLMAEARAAFQQGNRDEGYAKYQEIADKYYAASSYRNVKRWLAERTKGG